MAIAILTTPVFVEALQDSSWQPWVLPPAAPQPYCYPLVWIIRLGWTTPSLVDPVKLLPELEEAGLYWKPHHEAPRRGGPQHHERPRVDSNI